jgi:hypothetical protein
MMQPGFRGRLLGLCLPPVLLALLDGGLTLVGQSSDYWAGDYGDVNELSPTFHQLLAYHPLAYAGGFIAWVVMFVVLILLLPRTLALTASIAIAMSHTGGASTWLLFRFHLRVPDRLCPVRLHGLCVGDGNSTGWGAEPKNDAPLGSRWSVAVRWAAIIAIFALTTYLYLWPRRA